LFDAKISPLPELILDSEVIFVRPLYDLFRIQLVNYPNSPV